MLHRRRVRRYQEFLKTLRRPEPQLCLCPFHLHPRPWVPPPCRTSRPHGAMERKSLSQKDKAQHSRYIERLHHEEDLIKEAQRRVHNGDPLPKDMYNTVMKWSKMSPKLEEETTGAGQRREKKQQTSHIGRKKGTSEREFEKEEEKLRQELKNVRDLNQHNIYLLEENKRLMKKPESTAVTKTDEMYSEALTLIVRRLESLQIGRGEVEGMMGTIKDTINTCLQEWRDSFQQTRAQQDQHKNQLQHENEELQRKLRTRNKKIETLQKQNEDQQRQNEKLLHQCSLLESQMASTRTTEQLGILSGLPQKVQEAEHQLADTKELLHKAQVENQGLQSQLKHLEEKLGKKESKLKTEREQSLSREKEVAGARESVSSLQHQLEEMRREMNQLCEQLSTKDVILEHTSAQLEERIRECASLSALADRYKLQQNQDSDRIQTQLNERETASHKQLLEAQTQASRFQAQVSALRTEKEHTEKSLRCTVRKLEEQVDQLQLRNSTLQRQLTTFTSTYHNLFSSVDLPSVTTPAIDTTVFKGI
ncbi:Outer dense fiber protein 2 [Portunus trituberculatus]|uniref:Outer dense fiber protein 2 n=1 Tax=Portunus trituberculatus TaxID=210409 RepID=A0A5B7D4V6_PORTR|nr:Outer dense fiber protein 2 [Portunus trituberculatus]